MICTIQIFSSNETPEGGFLIARDAKINSSFRLLFPDSQKRYQEALFNLSATVVTTEIMIKKIMVRKCRIIKSMPLTAYPKVDTLLEDFISILMLTFRQNLVGVYLYGSLATEDFDEELSDIDLLMVLNNEVGLEQLHSLTIMHNKFKVKYKAWSTRIDVAYLSRKALKTFKTETNRAIVSDGKGALKIVEAPEYYLIDWYKVQEHAITLYGPQPSRLIPHITKQEFTKTIYNYLITWPEHVNKSRKRGQQAYAILTVCRSFYAYKYGKHLSKKAGAQWAMAEYPQWSDLIQKALEWNRDKKMSAIDDQVTQQQTLEFVKFLLDKTGNKI